MTFVQNKLTLHSGSLPNKILNTNIPTLVKTVGTGNAVYEYNMNGFSEQTFQEKCMRMCGIGVNTVIKILSAFCVNYLHVSECFVSINLKNYLELEPQYSIQQMKKTPTGSDRESAEFNLHYLSYFHMIHFH